MGPTQVPSWATILFLASGALLLSALYYLWARLRLNAWARKNQVRVLQCQWRLFLRGPYDAIGKYVVFRVTAENPAGGERVGWVRLGGFWAGLLTDESDVVWERPA
jgi:hypothetical protein